MLQNSCECAYTHILLPWLRPNLILRYHKFNESVKQKGHTAINDTLHWLEEAFQLENVKKESMP